MKPFAIPTLTLLTALSTQLALAANPCGEPAGTYTDVDSSQLISRTITRYKNDTGYVYTYELDLGGIGPSSEELHDGLTYGIKVTLDGKSAMTQGQMGCTTVSIQPIFDGRCVDPQNQTDNYAIVSPAFFTYASNGDHLNVWEGDVSVLDPKTARFDAPTHFRFNEKKFSEMNFQ